MTKLKKTQTKVMNPQPEKRDILTEMFEHFGIKVIDVTNAIPKTKYRKKLK
ncbi:MAG: hypothetical protein Q7R77_00640 [Candidatus Daviesbacteria bacterium]|nr:hypothetical protein [Candidatus Daviesbacteria bacterium]